MTMSNQRRRWLLATIAFAGTSLLHGVEAFSWSPFHSKRVHVRKRHDTATTAASSLPTLHVLPKPSHLTLLKANTSEESPPSSLEEGSILGASLLFAGTAVGAGMLALPAETLDSGFIPTLSGLIICWMFTYVTSLATLEASWTALQLTSADVVDESLSSKASGGAGGGASFLSISRRALGVPGEIVTGALFWFLLTAIVVAYTAEGGQLIAQFVDEMSSSSIQLTPAIGSAIFAIFFGTLGTFGTSRIDAINRVFVLGLVSTFVGLVGFGLPQINASNLISQSDWTTLYPNLISIGILSFGAQNVVPTLLNYLGGDPNRTRRAILFGSLTPLLLYAIWEAVFLGIVSVDGVAEEFKMDVITVLGATGGPVIKDFVEVFSACAIGSSMAGASVSLVDFFEDGLGSLCKKGDSGFLAHEKEELGSSTRILAAFFALGPPVILAYAFPDIFLIALEEAGLLGGVSLYGILPALSLLSLRRFTVDELDALLMPGRIGGGDIALYTLAGVSSLLVLPEVIHLGSMVVSESSRAS